MLSYDKCVIDEDKSKFLVFLDSIDLLSDLLRGGSLLTLRVDLLHLGLYVGAIVRHAPSVIFRSILSHLRLLLLMRHNLRLLVMLIHHLDLCCLLLLQLLVERLEVDDLVVLEVRHILVDVVRVGVLHALAKIVQHDDVEDGHYQDGRHEGALLSRWQPAVPRDHKEGLQGEVESSDPEECLRPLQSTSFLFREHLTMASYNLHEPLLSLILSQRVAALR